MTGAAAAGRCRATSGPTSAPALASLRLWGATAFGLVGIGGALATIYASPAQKEPVLSCGVEMLSCEVALSSPVSRVGGIPLGVLGVFYFAFWMLCLRAFWRAGKDEYRVALTWGMTLGATVSVSLAAYMFGVLGAPCLYCLTTHAANLGAVLLLWPWRRWRPSGLAVNDVGRFAAAAAVAVLAATASHFANESRQTQARLPLAERAGLVLVEAPTAYDPYAPDGYEIGYELDYETGYEIDPRGSEASRR